jgi:hypothetical protein
VRGDVRYDESAQPFRYEVDRALSEIYRSGEVAQILARTFGDQFQLSPTLQALYPIWDAVERRAVTGMRAKVLAKPASRLRGASCAQYAVGEYCRASAFGRQSEFIPVVDNGATLRWLDERGPRSTPMEED